MSTDAKALNDGDIALTDQGMRLVAITVLSALGIDVYEYIQEHGEITLNELRDVVRNVDRSQKNMLAVLTAQRRAEQMTEAFWAPAEPRDLY